MMPTRVKPRSLSSILIEESSRVHNDGVLKKVLDAEARPPRTAQQRWYHRLKKRVVYGSQEWNTLRESESSGVNS